MTYAIQFNPSLRRLALAVTLATLGASAMAQSPPAAPSTPPNAAAMPSSHAERHGHGMGKHDPAKMQAWMAKRQAELKTALKITPSQESAWANYTAAMQPPAGMSARPTPEQRDEMAKLTTPQRVDKMREMRTQQMTDMNARMDKRGEATKALYAALTPEQQKMFDAQHQHKGRHGHGGPGHQGPRG